MTFYPRIVIGRATSVSKGWEVRGSNFKESEIMITGSLSRENSVLGVALTTHPNLAQRLKIKWSYTSSTPLYLHGLF
jgi:hypothetical protein